MVMVVEEERRGMKTEGWLATMNPDSATQTLIPRRLSPSLHLHSTHSKGCFGLVYPPVALIVSISLEKFRFHILLQRWLNPIRNIRRRRRQSDKFLLHTYLSPHQQVLNEL